MQFRGHLLTPTGFVRGTLDVADGRIRSIAARIPLRADTGVPLGCPASSTCTCTAAAAPTRWTPAAPSTPSPGCTPGMAPPACWPPR
jgi:hypothetical protein